MGVALVTGATGHVGANIVAHLNQQGIRPKVLLRQHSKTHAIDDLEWEPVYGDVTDPESLQAAFEGVEVVYHVAAMVSFWRKNRARMDRVNVQGTQHVIDASLKQGVSRLVYTSSVVAVGHAGGPTATMDEDSPWNYGEFDMVYADSKHRSEVLVREAVHKDKLSAVIVNPALVLGERDVNLNAATFLIQIHNGWILAASPGTQAICDADDVARAHLAAAERGADGRRYIVCSACLPYLSPIV